MMRSTVVRNFGKTTLILGVLLLCACPRQKQLPVIPPATPTEMVQKTQAAAPWGSGSCVEEGAGIEGKDLSRKCCEGLNHIDASYPKNGVCVRDAPPSVMVCARCGDKICGKGENWCNCPADCPK